jgi:hypothetical protein
MRNELLDKGFATLEARLPPGWQAVLRAGSSDRQDAAYDAEIRITASDRRRARVAVQVKDRVEPRDALRLATLAASLRPRPPLLISRFLSKATRERLSDVGLNWLDLTGNVRLILSEPGLYVETQGAQKRPEGEGRPARTLKGDSAGRVVRALLRSRPPIGVRELAAQAAVDPGYASRVLDLLDSAALVERNPRGPVESVDRVRLLRRWAEDAPLRARGESAFYFEPRGVAALLERLKATNMDYAITGSVAAQQFAAIAPPRLAQVYVRDYPAAAAAELGLRAAKNGGNVQLIRPRDGAVLTESSSGSDGLRYASPVQVAADLLTAPGRGPNEGEEMLRWMSELTNAWR